MISSNILSFLAGVIGIRKWTRWLREDFKFDSVCLAKA